MWLYNGAEFTEADIGDNVGFVYIITNTISGRRYIGKKLFHFKKTRQVKGKKKRYLVNSDWQDYWGSNDELLKDIEQHGQENFVRNIHELCPSKGECSYHEARLQFLHDVLRYPDLWYNTWIMVRTHRRHLKCSTAPQDKTTDPTPGLPPTTTAM